VLNRDLIEYLDSLVNKRDGKVIFTYAKNHLGNFRVNRLSRKAAAIRRNKTTTKKLSPYNSFMKTNLPKIKKDNPHLSHSEAFKLVASMWKDSDTNPKNLNKQK
ncbi:9392_t:CDS:1, partial [Racocetra fulgida]